MRMSRSGPCRCRRERRAGSHIQIQGGDHLISAADPLPADVHQILEGAKTRAITH
jgi:hypothetical protein